MAAFTEGSRSSAKMPHPESSLKAESDSLCFTTEAKPEYSEVAVDQNHAGPRSSTVPANRTAQIECEEYPSTPVAVTIVVSCALSLFLLSLVRYTAGFWEESQIVPGIAKTEQDKTIVGVAIPQITREFRKYTLGVYHSIHANAQSRPFDNPCRFSYRHWLVWERLHAHQSFRPTSL